MPCTGNPDADLDVILAALPLGYVGPDNDEPVPPEYGPEADEYEWLGRKKVVYENNMFPVPRSSNHDRQGTAG